MRKIKLRGRPKVTPSKGSPDGCPKCVAEVKQGKLRKKRDVTIQYDVHFGDDIISYYRCNEHDIYYTDEGMKTTKDSLILTYSNYKLGVKFII